MKIKLVLPFATSSGSGIRGFTKDMEMAAVLYLAESNRKKGEGHILKKSDEKLVFLAEGHYPIWSVPWNGGTLLFDGLGIAAHTLYHDKSPDLGAFKKDIESARTSEAYSAVLSQNADYFKRFVGEEEETIEGLISSPDFMRDFSAYLPEAKEIERPTSSKAFLPPIINKSEISASVAKLSNAKARIAQDVENTNATMRTLNTTTRENVKAIRAEIKQTRKGSDRKIRKVRRSVTQRTRRIRAKYNKRIATISRRFQKQLGLLHKDRARYEKTWRHLKAEINRCEAKLKSRRRRKNKRAETLWTHRLRRLKKKLPVFEKSIREVDKKVARLESARNSEISQQRLKCESLIEQAMKPLMELEASREANIRMKQQEIASLGDTTSLITEQMNELAKSKRTALNKFDAIAVRRRRKNHALVYMPFYFARYEKEDKKRYVIYPPSTVSNMGILTKMKGAMGSPRMKNLLQPRSKAVSLFLSQIVTLIEKDSMFEKEVTETGIQNSILRHKKLRIGAKRGLKQLKDENWLSKDELQTLGKLLYIYA